MIRKPSRLAALLASTLLLSMLLSVLVRLPGLAQEPTGTPPLETTLTAQPSPSDTPVVIPTETLTSTATPELEATLTPSPTSTLMITSTATLEPTITPTQEPTFTPTLFPTLPPIESFPTPFNAPYTSTTLFLPAIVNPTATLLTCRIHTVVIPDNNPGGVPDSLTISSQANLLDVDVMIDIDHTWVGDLAVNLTHRGKSINLVHRPGYSSGTGTGCGANNVRAILDDEISLDAESQCNGSVTYGIGGVFRPNQTLREMDNVPASGDWTLNVADLDDRDTGSLKGWCVRAVVGFGGDPGLTNVPGLPGSARANGVPTHPQSLPLDCEARVAVDYAAFYGVNIGELQFQNRLPHSDDPDKGFVGNVNGTWGQIPPYAYGVHAEPVATLLREYGVSAYAHRPLSWDELRAEVAAHRPVYVWVVGSVYGGYPVYYTAASSQHLSIVAPREHVVMVVGYNSSTVTIQDNGNTYTRPINTFLNSWSSLGNMAIISHP